MILDFAIVIGGALVILVLAEIVIRQTVRVIHHYGLSGSFAGLTVLSIGTSLLEIMTHVVGSLRILRDPETMDTTSGLLLGSNVGTDIFQQNAILPFVGLAAAVVVAHRNLAIELGGLLGASLLLWLVCLDGGVSRPDGLLLVAAYGLYLGYLGRHGVHDAGPMIRRRLSPRRRMLAVALIVTCFAAMTLVADPVLGAASRLVAHLPMSASLFGVVVLGVCGALPELMTALVSVFSGEKEISAGILIGSNITNPLFGAGLGGLISTYTVPPVLLWYDLPVKVATGGLLWFFLLRHERLRPVQCVLLLVSYFGYIVVRSTVFPTDR